jgi:methylase of polypeptide subunit release factors
MSTTSVGVRLLSAANRAVRRTVYRSPAVTRLIFGSTLRPCGASSFWELGTLAIRQALSLDLRDGMRVVEVGTGPYATLALWAARRWRLEVVATELVEEWASWARQSAESNGLPVDVRCTDLLEGVEGTFDVAWFVPPFTPRAVFEMQMRDTGLSDDEERRRQAVRTCGGEMGWEVLGRFLAEVRPRLRPGGRAYVCVNHVHQSPGTVRRLAEEQGLRIVREQRLPLLPYSVVVVAAGGA